MTSTPIALPVRRVRVLEDRAQVERQDRLELPAGTSRLHLPELSPVVADRTVRAECVVLGPQDPLGPTVAGQVVSTRLRRALRLRAPDQPERHRQLREERDAARDRVEALESRLARRDGDLARLLHLRRQVLADLQLDVAWSQARPEAWASALAPVEAQEAELRAERVGLHQDLAEQRLLLEDLERRLAAADSPERHLGASLELELHLPQAGTVCLRLSYLVPAACWRPLHRATLAGTALQVETLGCVWQQTGEDWADAEITLSTDRASLGVEPPLLGEDELRARARQEQVVVETREQEIQTTGLGAAAATTGDLPGIDDGGEVRTLRVQGPATVASDGRPHLLPLARFECATEQDLVAMPERSAAVIRRVRARNAGPLPLLAGPVELVAEGGRVGRTSVLYVAPGERFELGFGPDPSLRVHRRVEKVEQEPGALSRWARTDHRVTLLLSNLGTEPRRFTLVERLPVSEVEQVKVEVDRKRSSPGCTPDADGMIRMEIQLEPGAGAERVVAWSIEKKRDVAGI